MLIMLAVILPGIPVIGFANPLLFKIMRDKIMVFSSYPREIASGKLSLGSLISVQLW